MPVPPEAFFLQAAPAEGGYRFCLFYPAQPAAEDATIRGLVLYIHPFAEEMNKSRRMAALQARALSSAGYAVLQIDLLGCGDSSGDFGDANWQIWISDVVQGCRWLQSRGSSATPLWLWGLRAGCLLAVDAASRLQEPCNFLFWQPSPVGKTLHQQFLRLRAAGDLLGGQAKVVMDTLRQSLANGTDVEIGGYRLSAALATGLEHAVLAPPANTGPAQRVEWLELSTREDSGLSPISVKTLGQWQLAGATVRSHAVIGPAFWQTSEIEEAPALIAATLAAMDAAAPA